MESDKKLKVLNWLSDIKFMDHHSFSRERRQENTGLWLEENEVYKEWKNSESSSLLWLRGDAGYGKTTLVSYVIDALKAQARGNEKMLAYFYCNYKEDSRRRPETVLRTLVKQFCLKSPGDPTFVPIPVSSIYIERERLGHASGELRCQESTDLIIDLSKMYHQVTIIVDALDECYQETRRDLFLSLKSIVKSGSNVKVFLASRFEQDIARMFEGYKCHYIQASDNTKDINNYIDRQLDIRCDVQKCGTEELLLDGDVDDMLKQEIGRTLKEKANGMFMWVNLQILALCEEPTANCVREALKKLPRDLKETYDLIIERTEARESSSRIARSVLGLLLSAQEPCSLPTILQALAVGPGSNKFDPDVLKLPLSRILDCCKNLVVDDRNTQNLRFAHFSVQEYLLSNPKFNDGSINHTTMAEICLKVLLDHHSKSESRLGDLMKYATKHWAAHLRLSGTVPQTSVLYKYCMEFLKPSTAYAKWVSTVEEEGDPFKGPNTSFVSPFWVACYYRLHDFLGVETRSEEVLNELNQNDGRTPLSWATGKGHDKVVELLLRHSSIGVNVADNQRRTPLSRAAEKGHDKVVRLLLRNSGTDVNITDGKRRTPLSWAAERGHDMVVEQLLRDSRANINLSDNIYHQTPLSLAAEHGHNKVVELLLRDSCTDVNISDNSYNQTPLSWAAEKGHYKVVELLLRDSRTNFNRANMDGRTPLSWAAVKGYDKMVELFLQGSGIDVNLADNYSRTPLSRAAEKGHDKVVRLLLRDSRTDVSITDLKRRTPLSWAAEKGHDKVVGLLLQDSRAGIDLANMNGRTSLSFAAEKGHYKVVELLLRDSRTDVNIRDNRYNRTPLSWAAINGWDKVVELLLTDSCIDINTVDKNGLPALLLAERNEHGKVVQLLSAVHGLKPS
ncbi:ankyrin repeat-containing domain protein [Morchella snyderi]|nr:ankyrin repeat-containing domain protein [Morchella snyderi]